MTGLMATVYVAIVLDSDNINLNLCEVRWSKEEAENTLIEYGRLYFKGHDFIELLPEDRTEVFITLRDWMREDGMDLVVMEATVK